MKTTATKEEAKPALIPKLRFPEFREADDWQTRLLGELCKIRTGKKDANEGASDGQYPFFTCAENHIFSHAYSFDAEAILIAGNANVGQTRYYHGKFEAYQRTYVLTDFSGISVPYLYAILNAKLRESLLAHVQVSAMSYIKLPMLQEYALAVPPSPAEQQKIASCLSSVDELMAAQARKLDALKTHKKGLMQQLFPRESETQPRLRFPEFQNAGEWEEDTLDDMATFRRGSFPQPYGLPEWYDDKNGMPFIQVFDVGDDFRLKDKTKSRISKLGAEKSVFIPKGTLIVTLQGSIGRVAITHYDAYIDRTLLIFESFQKPIEKVFFSRVIQNLFDIEKEKAPGGIIKTITKESLSDFKVKYPTLPEQQRIATCLSSLDALITAETQKLESIKTHKQGLMQQLFPSPEEVAV